MLYKDRFSRSQRSKIVYKASCWDCGSCNVGKSKRRFHDRKTDHFKALTQDCHASVVAGHVICTGHNIKWDHFEIMATGKFDLQCRIKETLLIRLESLHFMKTLVARSCFFINFYRKYQLSVVSRSRYTLTCDHAPSPLYRQKEKTPDRRLAIRNKIPSREGEPRGI